MEPKSVREQLIDHLKSVFPTKIASGELQRMEWINKDKTLASPKIVARRVQELAAEGILHVEYGKKNHAWYWWNDGKDSPLYKPKQVVEQLPNGHVRLHYV